jgi:hypothetical protein
MRPPRAAADASAVVYSAVELAAELGVDDGVSTMPEFVLWTLAGVFLELFPFALGMLTIFVECVRSAPLLPLRLCADAGASPTFSSAVRTLLFPARRGARASVDSDATLTVGTHPLPKLARASSAGDVSVLQFTNSGGARKRRADRGRPPCVHYLSRGT